MASGLVATMGMPANAVGHSSAEVAAAPATAPIAVAPAVALQGGVLAASATLQSTAAPLTAPAAAKVSFEDSAFKAIPKKVVAPVRSASSTVTGQSSSTVHASSVSAFGSQTGSSIIAVASRYLGIPYLYGGTTTAGFDCSGFTQYVYAQVGRTLPRTANEQMLATTRISRAEAVPGDLVFFTSGAHAYHVGLYLGGNMMMDAPHTGSSVGRHTIFSADAIFGRI